MPELITGTPVAIDFHNGKPRKAACGLEDCECPDHEWEYDHPRQPGLYVTFRVGGTDHARFGRRWQLIETDEAVAS